MIPTRIGQRAPGGRLAGIIQCGREIHAIIIASNAYCAEGLKVKTTATETPSAHSKNDGFANTIIMNNDEHPAAQYCSSLVVDGCNDFYLMAANEIEVCYRNLKPSALRNEIEDTGEVNRNSIPRGAEYTLDWPTKTVVTAFQTYSYEAFKGDSSWYATSSQRSGVLLVSLDPDIVECANDNARIDSRGFSQGRLDAPPKDTDYYGLAVMRTRPARRIRIV